jgi:hypothetical protein
VQAPDVQTVVGTFGVSQGLHESWKSLPQVNCSQQVHALHPAFSHMVGDTLSFQPMLQPLKATWQIFGLQQICSVHPVSGQVL